MDSKKNLAALATKKALAEKAVKKRKRPAHTAEERGIRRGPATPRPPPPPSMKRVEEVHPELPTVMTPPFLLRSTREELSHHPMTTQDRIRKALVLEDMGAYE